MEKKRRSSRGTKTHAPHPIVVAITAVLRAALLLVARCRATTAKEGARTEKKKNKLTPPVFLAATVVAVVPVATYAPPPFPP